MKGSDAGPRLEVRLLGRFDVRLDGQPVDLPSRPAQSLFAYLILTAGTAHRREKLAGMLWPDADEENGRSYLRHALWRIRRSLASGLPPDPHYLISDDISIYLDASASYRLDVAEFERSGEGESVDALMARLDLYRGELLPGFYEEWVVLERDRLDAVVPRRMERLTERLSQERRWPEVIEWAERWISLGQVPESAYRALMVAHHEQGDRAQIVAAYRRCVEALKREVDVAPSDQTRQLYERLAPGFPPSAVIPVASTVVAARAGAEAPAPGAPPFKGLHYFQETDADLFFGREALTDRLARRLVETSFLAVIGASGSGKSSILRAGLVPALRREQLRADGSDTPAGKANCEIRVITPTAHPLEALAANLTTDAGSTIATAALLDDLARDARSLRLHLRKTYGRSRTLLAVDQFEELFTLCQDAFEREAFVDNLLTAALPEREEAAIVVVALRADFYAHCAEYPALRDAVARHQEYIGPMSLEELRRAIEGPASKGGWILEPGLVDLVLHEVSDAPGALPLLSHALLETWRRRRGRVLTVNGYAASGGVRGAIARTAESVFGQLTAAEQPLARRIFVRLTELGEGTQDTRRRASIEELTSGGRDLPVVKDVLRVLAGARLITIGESTVEVAHEALIREWPRLREWLVQDREALRVQRHLTRSALEWERLGRDAGALYRGARLAQAVDRAREAPDELNELERAFLDASREQADREENEREAVRWRELESARKLAAAERDAALRLRRRALYLTLALFFLAGMAGAAVFFADQARQSAVAARLEQERALLESARAAAANVEAPIASLRDATNATTLRAHLIRLAEERDPGLGEVLGTLQFMAGPDTNLLFMTNYASGEVVGVSLRLSSLSELLKQRVEVARQAVAGTAPAVAEGCAIVQRLHASPGLRGGPEVDALSPRYVSRPYLPAAGEQPAVAIVKYHQPCIPYALTLEVSLRRAGEWMAIALDPADDAYLVDESGRLLARARRSETDYLRDLTSSDLVAAALASSDGFVRVAEDPLGGGPRVAAAVVVGDAGWRVIVLRPIPQAQNELEANLAQLLVLGALMAVLLLGASGVAFVSRRRRVEEGS